MKKRQETPYAAQVAKFSDKKLSEEIGRLMNVTMSDDSEENADKLRLCGLEDDKRGRGCWDKAIAKLNAAFGLEQTGPNQFHYHG